MATRAALSVAQYPLKNSAILDTGSTIDIFNEISRFLNFRAASHGDFLWAGEQKVPIQGYGDVNIAVKGPRGRQILRLYDMAYYENFACNLVSFRKLKRRGFWWDTRSDQSQTCLKRADNSIFAYLKDQYDQFVLKDIPEDLSRGSFFTRRNKFNTYTRRKPRKALAHVWH